MPKLHVAAAEGPATVHGEPVPARPALRLFAAARQAAGAGTGHFDGRTVGEVLDAACLAYGPAFAAVLATSRTWLNGEPAGRDAVVTATDELAVLPPVSGGA